MSEDSATLGARTLCPLERSPNFLVTFGSKRWALGVVVRAGSIWLVGGGDEHSHIHCQVGPWHELVEASLRAESLSERP